MPSKIWLYTSRKSISQKRYGAPTVEKRLESVDVWSASWIYVTVAGLFGIQIPNAIFDHVLYPFFFCFKHCSSDPWKIHVLPSLTFLPRRAYPSFEPKISLKPFQQWTNRQLYLLTIRLVASESYIAHSPKWKSSARQFFLGAMIWSSSALHFVDTYSFFVVESSLSLLYYSLQLLLLDLLFLALFLLFWESTTEHRWFVYLIVTMKVSIITLGSVGLVVMSATRIRL